MVGSYTVNAGTYSLTAQNFDAWGNWVSGTGTGTISQFGYTGREPNETGLVYYRARYYNPAIGRFTSRDPSGLSAGINLYAYANNNPVNFNDPFGLTANSPLGIAYAAADTSYFNTSSDAQPPPYVQLGKAYAGVAAVVVGWTTNNDFLKNAGIEGLSEAQNDNVNLLLMLGTMGRGGSGSASGLIERDIGFAKSPGQLGREGEAAVRSVYDIGAKVDFTTATGAVRIPDGINLRLGTLSEVKNVQNLSFTSQLRDYTNYAEQQGLTFNLYVRPGANLTTPLENAINSGRINLFNIP